MQRVEQELGVAGEFRGFEFPVEQLLAQRLYDGFHLRPGGGLAREQDRVDRHPGVPLGNGHHLARDAFAIPLMNRDLGFANPMGDRVIGKLPRGFQSPRRDDHSRIQINAEVPDDAVHELQIRGIGHPPDAIRGTGFGARLALKERVMIHPVPAGRPEPLERIDILARRMERRADPRQQALAIGGSGSFFVLGRHGAVLELFVNLLPGQHLVGLHPPDRERVQSHIRFGFLLTVTTHAIRLQDLPHELFVGSRPEPPDQE